MLFATQFAEFRLCKRTSERAHFSDLEHALPSFFMVCAYELDMMQQTLQKQYLYLARGRLLCAAGSVALTYPISFRLSQQKRIRPEESVLLLSPPPFLLFFCFHRRMFLTHCVLLSLRHFRLDGILRELSSQTCIPHSSRSLEGRKANVVERNSQPQKKGLFSSNSILTKK